MTNVKEAYDEELLNEFQKLVVNLGKDVTKNNVLPLVQTQFKNIEESQIKLINKVYAELAGYNNKLVDSLSLTLESLNRHKNTIDELNRLNRELVENINVYFDNSDSIEAINKLISYNETIEKSINSTNELYKNLQKQNMDYIGLVSSKIEDMDKLIDNVTAISNSYLEIRECLEKLKGELQGSIEKNMEQLKSV